MIVLTGESGCDASGVRHSCSKTETQRFDWDDGGVGGDDDYRQEMMIMRKERGKLIMIFVIEEVWSTVKRTHQEISSNKASVL